MKLFLIVIFSVFSLSVFSQVVVETIPLDTTSMTYKVIYRPTLTKQIFSKKIAVFANDTSVKAIGKNYAYNYLNGIYRIYYPSGKIRIFANYANNKLHGDWSLYNENGGIIIKGRYKNGIKHGFWAYRKVKCFGRYKKGIKKGRWKCIDKSGNTNIIKYNKGKAPQTKEIDDDQITKPTETNQPLPVIDTFYRNAITYLTKNYYLRNRIKTQFAENKKDKKMYDKYFNYKKDIFLFNIAPIVTNTGLGPFLKEGNPLKSTKIDSILKSNPDKYRLAFSNYEIQTDSTLLAYSTDRNSNMTVFFSKIFDNLLRLDLIEYPDTILKQNFKENYMNNKGKKFAIIFYFNKTKEVEAVEYQQNKAK